MSRNTRFHSRRTDDTIDRPDHLLSTRAAALERSARRRHNGTVQSRSPQKFPQLILLSIWFAWLPGWSNWDRYTRNHVMGWSTLSSLQISRHFPWMIPVANLVLSSVGALSSLPLLGSGTGSAGNRASFS